MAMKQCGKNFLGRLVSFFPSSFEPIRLSEVRSGNFSSSFFSLNSMNFVPRFRLDVLDATSAGVRLSVTVGLLPRLTASTARQKWRSLPCRQESMIYIWTALISKLAKSSNSSDILSLEPEVTRVTLLS